MINKRGHKTDKTVYMENTVHKYFIDKYGVELKHEYHMKNGNIPDFYREVTVDGKKQDSIIVEIKQTASDFYSGHGLNFTGMSNYIAVPTNLIGLAVDFLKDNFPYRQDIGILEITDSGLVRTTRYPKWGFFTPYHLLYAA